MSIDSFRGEYHFLSNFHQSPVTMYGESYPTVEHAFQAAKALHPEDRERIRIVAKPGDAKRLGRRVQLRPDWEDVKLSIMYTLVARKFQDSTLRHQLLQTGDEYLVEGNTWNDTFWGVCNGEGRNYLGLILMRVRSEIRLWEEHGYRG